jgi:hypothetical protein
MKLNGIKNQEKLSNNSNEFDSRLQIYLEDYFNKNTFSQKEDSNPNIVEGESRNIINLSMFLRIIHDILRKQLDEWEDLKDDEIIDFLPKIRERISLPENIYLGLELALIEFLSQRKLTRGLISNDISKRKNLVRNHMKEMGFPVDDSVVYDMANNMIVEKGILGCHFFMDKQTFDKHSPERGLGFFYQLKYKPNFYKKNKKDYKIGIPVTLVPNLGPDTDLEEFSRTTNHEDMHGLYLFIKQQLKSDLSSRNDSSESKVSSDEINKLMRDYINEIGDINDISSEKYQKFKVLLDAILKIRTFRLKYEFSNEMAARVEDAYIQYLKTNDIKHFLNEIRKFINLGSYHKVIYQNQQELKDIFKDPSLDSILNKELRRFNSELADEYFDICDIVLKLTNYHPDFSNLVSYLISVSDIEFLKSNLENLFKFYETHERGVK